MKWFQLTAAALAACLSLLAQPAIPDFTPETPLIRAALHNDTAGVVKLLENGADPNQGRFAGFTPVFLPIMKQNPEMFRAMVAKGADVQVTDHTGSTTLMWAAAGEYGETEILGDLIRLGLDPNKKNNLGETALDWALRRGHTPAVAALRAAGASSEKRIRESVELALSLLQKSSVQFLRVSGCTSCHHQSLPQMLTALARERGWAVNQDIARQQKSAGATMIKMLSEIIKTKPEGVPDPPIVVGYYLLGLHAEGYAADETTTDMVRLIAAQQLSSGGFHGMAARQPMESSDITATALAMRAMQLYGGPESSDAIARAAAWLKNASPANNEDRAMRLLGLSWGRAERTLIERAAREILAEQHPDGGWSQTAYLETDAYATGQSLVALWESGIIPAADDAYRRGTDYLLRTQLADGSWLVRTRSFPFQPLKESGFPHGRHQWISAAGTSWAAMALALAVEPPRMESGGE